MNEFAVVANSIGSFAGSTTAVVTGSSIALPGGTTTREESPLETYFTCKSQAKLHLLELILNDPPPVADIIYSASVLHAGVEAQERATDLLGHLTFRTLQYAMQFEAGVRAWRPIYANKIWEIIISSLGLADGPEATYSLTYVMKFLESPDLIKRQAAIDAVDALSPEALAP